MDTLEIKNSEKSICQGMRYTRHIWKGTQKIQRWKWREKPRMVITFWDVQEAKCWQEGRQGGRHRTLEKDVSQGK